MPQYPHLHRRFQLPFPHQPPASGLT
jgi:hypothetical protein